MRGSPSGDYISQEELPAALRLPNFYKVSSISAFPQLPTPPPPPGPLLFSLEDSEGEQLVSEGLIRAQRPWLRARVREPGGQACCHLSGPFLPGLDSEFREGSCWCPGWSGGGSCRLYSFDLAD